MDRTIEYRNKYEKLLGKEWYKQLEEFIDKGELSKIAKVVNNERNKGKTIIPEKGSLLLFKAFREIGYKNLKVIALGQD